MQNKQIKAMGEFLERVITGIKDIRSENNPFVLDSQIIIHTDRKKHKSVETFVKNGAQNSMVILASLSVLQDKFFAVARLSAIEDSNNDLKEPSELTRKLIEIGAGAFDGTEMVDTNDPLAGEEVKA